MKRYFAFGLMALGIPWIWKTLAAIAVASLLVWLCGCTYLQMEAIEKINHLPFHPVYDHKGNAGWYEEVNK